MKKLLLLIGCLYILNAKSAEQPPLLLKALRIVTPYIPWAHAAVAGGMEVGLRNKMITQFSGYRYGGIGSTIIASLVTRIGNHMLLQSYLSALPKMGAADKQGQFRDNMLYIPVIHSEAQLLASYILDKKLSPYALGSALPFVAIQPAKLSAQIARMVSCPVNILVNALFSRWTTNWVYGDVGASA